VAVVPLVWEWIDVEPKEKWADIKKKLSFNVNQLNRAVYVIRLNGKFLVRYPWAKSPVVYIGEGDLPERLKSPEKHGCVPLRNRQFESITMSTALRTSSMGNRFERAG
jgi:hypothetical protein